MSPTKRPDGKWRARYRDATGKEHAKHFDRKIDAERWLATVKIAQGRGEWIDPALSKVTVGEWAARWLENQVQLKPSTRQRYSGLLRAQVLPAWERVPLTSVAHSDVGAWVRRMTQAGLAPSTVRQAHRVFSLLLSLAVRDGRLTRNVAAGVRLPRAGGRRRSFSRTARSPRSLQRRSLTGSSSGCWRTPGCAGASWPRYACTGSNSSAGACSSLSR
jgi:hypothetical protein